jgi:hypothetical protein
MRHSRASNNSRQSAPTLLWHRQHRHVGHLPWPASVSRGGNNLPPTTHHGGRRGDLSDARFLAIARRDRRQQDTEIRMTPRNHLDGTDINRFARITIKVGQCRRTKHLNDRQNPTQADRITPIRNRKPITSLPRHLPPTLRRHRDDHRPTQHENADPTWRAQPRVRGHEHPSFPNDGKRPVDTGRTKPELPDPTKQRTIHHQIIPPQLGLGHRFQSYWRGPTDRYRIFAITCPFAGCSAGWPNQRERFRRYPATTVRHLVNDQVSVALNPRSALFAARGTLLQRLREDGVTGVVDLAETLMRTRPWALYRVRRVAPKPGVVYRSVHAHAHGTRTAMTTLLHRIATHTNTIVDSSDRVPRLWVTRRVAKSYPAVEEMYVATLAQPHNKARPGFDTQWQRHAPESPLSDQIIDALSILTTAAA